MSITPFIINQQPSQLPLLCNKKDIFNALQTKQPFLLSPSLYELNLRGMIQFFLTILTGC